VKLDFTGRRVAVIGAAQGIGQGIVQAFLGAGAATVTGFDVEDGFALPAPARAVRCDLTDPEQVAAGFGEAGPVDILVSAAGGVRGQVGRPVETVTPADWHAILDANMTAQFLATQAVAPTMKAAGWGRIVILSSGAGLGVSLTGIQAYAAAKAGVIGLVRQLAHELGPFGVTVNGVAPGFLRSNPSSERQWQSYGEAGQQAMIARIATRRLGRPEDIAAAVLFFASDHASWINGQTLAVDGGK
jgi:3-oxoacyl-[acyl-carrier protein] reductase